MKDKKKPIISIIVPIYNSREYLDRCIESLVHQTFKDLEIILVDDGSLDNSYDICKKWKKKDARISCYSKKNGGTASARNYGIDIANGLYIGFVDSDDYVAADMYESLYKGCTDNNSDIAITGINRGDVLNDSLPKILQSSDALSMMLVDGFSCCNKLYKKKLFKDIRFPENNSYEDILTLPYLIDKCNKLFFDGKNSYYYVQNNSSKVHSKFNKKKMDYFYNTEVINNYICKKHPQLENECSANYCLVCTTLLGDIYPEKSKYVNEYNMLKSKLKKKYFSMTNKSIIPFYKRIMIMLSMHNAVFVVNIIKKIKK